MADSPDAPAIQSWLPLKKGGPTWALDIGPAPPVANATGITSQYQRIVVTDDAGRTWRIQYTGP